MASPTLPIEIWAAGDVELPVALGPNKVRPINDLWYKGYDKTEKPGVEEFNYLLNMLSLWVAYINGEQIPDLDNRFLQKINNLSDVADVNIARTNLVVYSKSESDQRFVNVTGDTMTGTLNLPRVSFTGADTANTDVAYIEATTFGTDGTYLDLVVGDNVGTAGSGTADSIRLRAALSGANAFTMVEVNPLTATTALARITGNLIVSGSITASSLTATTGTFTNATVTGTLTTNILQATTSRTATLTATGQIQGQTVVATSSMTTPSIRVNGTTNTNVLLVNNNNAVVAGRNIVRSINGITADGNGNVVFTAGVTDVRWSGQTNSGRLPDSSWSYVPAGAAMTGIWLSHNGSTGTHVDNFAYRYLQKLVNGSWITVSAL